MHRNVDWFTPADEYILEYIAECGGMLKPSSIALNVPYQQQWVRKRCVELADRGLLNKVDEGVYEITELGERVVAGEVDPGEL